ncbi:restriction endonuclease subunit S [Rhizobium sp. BG4]|uniref:restriction endonuclease subunit S n=1 Tax=Rhizobium sp. BG4 TaxID=2613770 RepID=UPI00193D8A41|nr:restriction endonuclease subunit S [Rhizobium sp. BG4]
MKLEDYPVEIIDGDRGAEYPKKADFTPAGYCLFLNAGNVTADGFAFDQCAFISEERDRKLRKGRLLRNDTVVTTRGTVGNFAFYGPTVQYANVRINSGMVILRPDLNKLLPRFFYFAVRSPSFDKQIKSLTSGSAQPQLPIRDMRKLHLPLPPIEEQRRIVEVIGSLDDKIELNRRMNETLEAMAQAIFRDWFVDFGPTRRKLEGASDPFEIMGGLVTDVERAQALADLFPIRLGDNGLPEGWREAEVASVVTLLKRGIAPSYCDDGVLVINQKCIRGKAVNFTLARRHDVAKRAPKERALEKDDVLVNSTGVGTLGRVATVRGLKEAATVDSHVTICRADASKISKLILSLFMEDKQSLIETLGHGSTGQTELNAASLGGLVVTVAPKSLQSAFDEVVGPLRDLVTCNSDQSGTLAATRDILLPKLMSGEIRLQEADEVLEAAQ